MHFVNGLATTQKQIFLQKIYYLGNGFFASKHCSNLKAKPMAFLPPTSLIEIAKKLDNNTATEEEKQTMKDCCKNVGKSSNDDSIFSFISGFAIGSILDIF